MQQHIESLTSSFVKRIPDDRVYVTVDDLYELNFPAFIVKRVEVELHRNLDDSIIVPETDWADMSNEVVESSWNQFLDAIHDVARLPKSFAHTVFEAAVADTLELLVRPRKQLIEHLFGPDVELSYQELSDRAEAISVYPFLTNGVLRFMQRKERAQLNRETATKLVIRIDEKVVSRYTPLNWAQLIQPWFTLMGDHLDSELIRQFFEDKERPHLASLFDNEDGTVSRTRFIELISQPDFDEDDQDLADAGTFRSSIEKEIKDDREEESQEIPRRRFTLAMDSDEESLDVSGHNEEGTSQSEDQDRAHKAETEQADEFEKQPDEPQPEAQSEQEVEDFPGEDPFEKELEALKKGKVSEEDSDNDNKDEPQDYEEVERSLLESFQASDEEDDHGSDFLAGISEGDDEEDGSEKNEKGGSSLLDQLSEEENEDDEVELYGESEEETDEETPFEEEPIIDLTEDDDPVADNKEEINKLSQHLEDRKTHFVDVIFGGDENALVEATEDLAEFKNWETASKYIWSEIFRINNVDRYAEDSIDFIDRLQSYFIDKKHRMED